MLTRRQPTLPGPPSAGVLGGSSLEDPFGRVGASKWGSLEEAGGDCGCGSGTKPGFGRSPDRDVPGGCGCAETRESPSAGVNCRPDTRSLDALDAAAERTGAAFAGLDRVTPGGQVGGPPPPPSVRGPTLPGTELVEPGQYLGETSRLVQDSGVGTSSRRLGPPPFKGLNIYTQLCFAKIYGQAEWPAHTCQGPRINPTDSCDLTPSAYASEIIGCMNNHGNGLDSDSHRLSDFDLYAAPTPLDSAYWRDALGLLIDNFDIARWALCLVESWSPEVRGLKMESEVAKLVTPNAMGTIPLSVTYVKGVFEKDQTQPDGSVVYRGATAWAFTQAVPARSGDVGVVQAIWNEQWIERRANYERGGQAALCACTQLAAMILHEMVHIVGDFWDHTKQRRTNKETYGVGYVSPYPMMTPDNTGTLHEPDEEPEGGGDWVEWPCWDECHMVESIFVWAMAQRYTCLSHTREDSGPPTGGLGGGSKTDYSSGCHRMGADDLFALSFGTLAQISNKSGEKGYRPDRKL